MNQLADNVELSWVESTLSTITDDNHFGKLLISLDEYRLTHPLLSEEPTKALTTEIWKIFKTLLFSTVLVSQSFLTVIKFHRPPAPLPSIAFVPSQPWSPHALAARVLSLFNHLAFISSKMGSGTTSSGGGFTEQKRAYFTALDILSQDYAETEVFVTTSAQGIHGPHFPLSSQLKTLNFHPSK